MIQIEKFAVVGGLGSAGRGDLYKISDDRIFGLSPWLCLIVVYMKKRIEKRWQAMQVFLS